MLRIAGIYAGVVLVAFGTGYQLLHIREMGLYLFLLGLGLPSSCAVVPLSERFASVAGSAPHVWSTLLVCIAVNIALFTLARALVRSWNRGRDAG